MNLDPLLAPALQLEQLPVVLGRHDMLREAELLTGAIERVSEKAKAEADPTAAAQLANVANALSVMVISLVAYTRGRTPRVSSKKPNANIIV